MAFKGTWHRADGGGNQQSNDRRFGSSNDSYSSFGGGVQNNQMNLGSMNYQTNTNTMYPLMNSGPSMNYSSAGKSLPYTGTISNIYRDYGVIDNEISFKLNTILGPSPRVGDRVVCQMKPADGFGGQTPYKYFGFDVRSVQQSSDNRRAPPVSRNADPYLNRNQSSNVKRPLPSNNNRDRPPRPMNNGSNSTNDRHRSNSNGRSSHSRPTKLVTPKRTTRPSAPKYNCTLPKASLDRSELNVTEIRSRYSRLHIPSDFYHSSYTWHQSIPLDRPLKFITPCSFHVFNKHVPRVATDQLPNLDPTDADYTWNVRVCFSREIVH